MFLRDVQDAFTLFKFALPEVRIADNFLIILVFSKFAKEFRRKFVGDFTFFIEFAFTFSLKASNSRERI